MNKKRNIVGFVAVIFLTIFFFNCVEPTSDAEYTSIYDWLGRALEKLEKLQLDPEVRKLDDNQMKQQELVISKVIEKPVVIKFPKEKSVCFLSKKEIESDLIYSLDNNEFILKQPVYITNHKDKLFVSYDSQVWYTMDNINFETKMKFDYVPDNSKDKNLIRYSFAVSQKKNAKSIRIGNNKRVIDLRPNMLLANKDDKELSVDLKRVILYIPADTIITGELNLSGNIVVGKNSVDNAVSISSLRDIFIYLNYNKKHISMSFDNKNWNVMIFSIKFSSFVKIISLENRRILFNLFGEFNHKE